MSCAWQIRRACLTCLASIRQWHGDECLIFKWLDDPVPCLGLMQKLDLYKQWSFHSLMTHLEWSTTHCAIVLRSSRTPLSLIGKDQIQSIGSGWNWWKHGSSCHQTAALFSLWAVDGFRLLGQLRCRRSSCRLHGSSATFFLQGRTNRNRKSCCKMFVQHSHCTHMSWVETWWQIKCCSVLPRHGFQKPLLPAASKHPHWNMRKVSAYYTPEN